MTLDAVIDHCLAKPGAEETYPFGDHVMAVKVGGKVFAFVGQEPPGSIAVKCGTTREEAAWLRERYPDAVTPMAYLARYGWNHLDLDADVPHAEVEELIDASYDAVLARLPRAKRP